MTTITGGTTTLTPLLITGYSSTRQTGNIVHAIIGRSDPDVTFKAAGLRTGTLEILVADLTSALAMEALHAAVGTLQLVEPTAPGLGMKYVSSGAITVTLDDETRDRFIVGIDFQEVL